MKYEKPEIKIFSITDHVITTSFDNIGEPDIDVDWEGESI